MNNITYGKRFRRNFKKIRNKKDQQLIKQTVHVLELIEPFDNGALPYCHKLVGSDHVWEIHVKPDLLIVFEFYPEIKEMRLFDIGNHNNVLE